MKSLVKGTEEEVKRGCTQEGLPGYQLFLKDKGKGTGKVQKHVGP